MGVQSPPGTLRKEADSVKRKKANATAPILKDFSIFVLLVSMRTHFINPSKTHNANAVLFIPPNCRCGFVSH